MNKIKKRSGHLVDFSTEKIEKAVQKAMLSVGYPKISQAKQIALEVTKELFEKFKNITPSVEDVQDLVEKKLIEENLINVAKAYILYRQKRTDLREAKKAIGVHDELKLTLNSVEVLKNRYLLKDENGKIIETPSQLFKRVAKAVAAAEKPEDRKKMEEIFYRMMSNLEFLPNSPTLMNAGTDIGQLSACFVIPIEDSIAGIFDSLKTMALIHQSGGGTGFSFSKLRPKGDIVNSTKGIASGPVSFMTIFDKATEVIKQGGKRRGANMGILDITHPDILEFISSKKNESVLRNFNISVAINENFMNAVYKNKKYPLINPRTGQKVHEFNAKQLFESIISMAWATGDPGVIFIDEINKHHTLKEKIESTNPCGEQPLLPYESCNLGSINLSKFLKEKKIDWKKLKTTIHNAVRFLDDVIDVNKYPLQQIKEKTLQNRKIGLGIMGFADMLLILGVPYNSKKALSLAQELMAFIEKEARQASEKLGMEKGSFPNFKRSTLTGYKAMRNATVTTIAPTGTISIIAGCSSGIEPLFAISYVRSVMDTHLIETNPIFEKIAKEKGFYSRKLMVEIAKKGSLQDLKEVPKEIKKIFVTAFDIEPEWHIKMQAAFQKHTDNAVSKTVNLPNNATIEDVRKIFLLAHKLKCKGITIYRYGSKNQQVLNIGEYINVKDEYSGGCLATECAF